eukprot:Gb_26993 [translate_table: standard]
MMAKQWKKQWGTSPHMRRPFSTGPTMSRCPPLLRELYCCTGAVRKSSQRGRSGGSVPLNAHLANSIGASRNSTIGGFEELKGSIANSPSTIYMIVQCTSRYLDTAVLHFNNTRDNAQGFAADKQLHLQTQNPELIATKTNLSLSMARFGERFLSIQSIRQCPLTEIRGTFVARTQREMQLLAGTVMATDI